MSAKLRGLAFITASLLIAGASSAKAEFVTVPISSRPLFPGESFNAFFPEEPDTIHQKKLTFEGSIQNASFSGPAIVAFWFDWIDGPTTFTTTPQFFKLDTVPTGHNFQFFTGPSALTYTIPYCPPEVSIHFGNAGPGGPVFVSGTFTYECVPEPAMLLILPVLVLMAPLAVRRMKALASA